MTQQKLEDLRQQNDWRPYHSVNGFSAVPTYQLIEFEEFEEFAEADAAEETTHAIYNMIDSF